MVSPSGEGGERVSLAEVIASWLSVLVHCEFEVEHNCSSSVRCEEDETGMDMKPLVVILAGVISAFDSPNKDILDFIPLLDLIQEPVKVVASVLECAVSWSEVDADVPLAVLFSPFRGKPLRTCSFLSPYWCSIVGHLRCASGSHD